MIKRIFFSSILAVLAYGFWISPDFKEISAGVAIFLFGMLSLEEGFKAFTGGLLENLLRKTTNTLWKSLSFGVVSTTLMQSSSLVSVITISFLSAGLISLMAGVGIIFGANLGTTTGAWLVAGFGLKVKISAYAMPMLVFGVILIFQKSRELKGIGYVLAGLGFLFLGIHHMKEGFEAFKDSIDLTQYAVSGYSGVFLFTLVGMLATVVMQSSHATLVLIITALAAQQITYENALALAIGANIGTTITAILGSLSSNIDGRRLAVAHLIFNMATALVAIIFIYQLTAAVNSISSFVGIAEDDYTLKLAVFHTLFNAIGIILMLPLMKSMVEYLQRAFKPAIKPETQPKYLNESVSELADTAIEAVRNETLRLYDNAFSIISSSLSLRSEDILSDKPLSGIVAAAHKPIAVNIDEEYNNRIKSLYSEIVKFISEAGAKMTPEQTDELFELRSAGRDIVEVIKGTKHLHKNLSQNLTTGDKVTREEYDKLRKQLAEVMRALDEARQDSDDSANILALDGLRADVKQNARKLDRRLDELVRGEKLSAQTATSLMNDATYTYNISKKLIKMGEVLFSTGESALREAERSIILDDHEIDELLDEQS